MAFQIALPLAYATSMAVFFAWLGRRKGFWWVAIPLLLGGGVDTFLMTLWLHTSPVYTPVAITTVFIPAAVSYANRSTGYRWWPSFAVGRDVVMALVVLGGLLLVSSISALVAFAVFGHQ